MGLPACAYDGCRGCGDCNPTVSRDYHERKVAEARAARPSSSPFTFADFERTITETAHYMDDDMTAIDGSPIPAYAALGLAGETAEVVELVLASLRMASETGHVTELVKKSMRARTPLDPAKLALELGDVLWYIARMANRMGLTLEQVAHLSDIKLRRRDAMDGKDHAAELEAARAYLRGGLS